MGGNTSLMTSLIAGNRISVACEESAVAAKNKLFIAQRARHSQRGVRVGGDQREAKMGVKQHNLTRHRFFYIAFRQSKKIYLDSLQWKNLDAQSSKSKSSVTSLLTKMSGQTGALLSLCRQVEADKRPKTRSRQLKRRRRARVRVLTSESRRGRARLPVAVAINGDDSELVADP